MIAVEPGKSCEHKRIERIERFKIQWLFQVLNNYNNTEFIKGVLVMLKQVVPLPYGISRLEVEFSGAEYQNALNNYINYVPDDFGGHFRKKYYDDNYPNGIKPIEVVEEEESDEIYKNIFKKDFPKLILEAFSEAHCSNPIIEKVSMNVLSRQKISCFVDIKGRISNSSESATGVDDPALVSGLEEAIKQEASSMSDDHLLLTSAIERDNRFWADLQRYCEYYADTIWDDISPILSELKLVNSRNNALYVDVASNLLRQLYPLFEATAFVCGVFSYALHRYIPDFSSQDDYGITQYIFTVADKIIEPAKDADAKLYQTLKNRLNDYYLVNLNHISCGYSLNGYLGLDFSGIESWSENPRPKCTLLFCDAIRYIKECGELLTLDNIEKIKQYSVKNTNSDVDIMRRLFNKANSTTGAILMTVRGAINGATRMERRATGKCQYCGGDFKKSLFGFRCSSCKAKKDY